MFLDESVLDEFFFFSNLDESVPNQLDVLRWATAYKYDVYLSRAREAR